jgi:AcrR family transcriptional regulator
MAGVTATGSPRREQIVDAAYRYAAANGLADMSLRPVAEAIGSSTGVLRFLFESKDGLVAAILERARAEELDLLTHLPAGGSLRATTLALWGWLSDPDHGAVLRLWVESYAASLRGDPGPWQDFAERTVRDWLDVLARTQPAATRRSAAAAAQRTAALALLRGAMLDLLATGDRRRTTQALQQFAQGLPD